MRKKLLVGSLAVVGLVCVSSMSSAATLDDVMARLDRLQRDNDAMRKEIAALRRERSAPTHTVNARHAPSRQPSPPATSAMAAVGYPVKGEYAPPQAFSWDGFYLGLHAGYGWGSNNWTFVDFVEAPGLITAPGINPRTNGILGGIQGGANYQTGMWVLGLEAEFAVMKGRNTATSSVGTNGTTQQLASTQIDWLASFAGRFGVAYDRSLFYLKGGVAAAEYQDHYSQSVNGPLLTEFSDSPTKTDTRVGWLIGAGWEYAFAPHWSAKVEYNYMDFGTERQAFTLAPVPGPETALLDIEHKLQVVKAGANYRF